MFKAIIVEDEIHNAEGLLYLLEKNCADVKVEAVCASVKEAAKKITELKPDLLFLDIHLGDGTGFQLLEKFPNPEFKVIFITAYDEYAIKAFKFSAVDYLLKPVDADELTQAVEKMKAYQPRPEFKSVAIGGMNKLPLPTIHGYIFLDIKDIIRCEASDNYTEIFVGKEKQVISRSLSVLEQFLADKGFLRVHRSHLVNLAHILSMEKGKTAYLKMADGESIPVSENYRKGLDDMLRLV